MRSAEFVETLIHEIGYGICLGRSRARKVSLSAGAAHFNTGSSRQILTLPTSFCVFNGILGFNDSRDLREKWK